MNIKLSNALAHILVCVFILMGFTSCTSRSDRAKHGIATEKAMQGAQERGPADSYAQQQGHQEPGRFNTEEYGHIGENEFLAVANSPLSTFSIDVDSASYSNIRRFINGGQLPPRDAVRIEEMINYFKYDYPQPEDDRPFSIQTEIARCPWNTQHKLVEVALQGRQISSEKLPPGNLVFLIDVSGSMDQPDKLPLLKSALNLLVHQLRESDHVAIVVYAGAAGLVLPSISGDRKEEILQAIGKLQAGGSTNGGEGISLAYQVARHNFIDHGNNRVILATDGDFNVGTSSDGELVRMIEEKRKEGIYLTVLGLGVGNLKDAKMEQLADKGNGNYAYLDSLKEAKKVLVNELGGTLYTIAKDVKIQVEFNPAKVQAYRLIGYENRLLRAEDFKDDKKDAGEIGAGHTVTALYEIIPTGVDAKIAGVDSLKYQTNEVKRDAFATNELMTVKLRYKPPAENASKLVAHTVLDSNGYIGAASNNFKFSAAVAQFGMLLRDSKFKANSAYANCLALAREAKGEDLEGYRSEFISLVERSETLVRRQD
jgi:Ca-activated chloride channel family protein